MGMIFHLLIFLFKYIFFNFTRAIENLK